MIGMILPVKKINRLLNDTEEHENFQFYFQLAEEFEVDLLIYSLKRLDIQQLKVEGYLYSYKDKKLDKEIVDLPKVNFFRIVLGKLESYQMLKEIEENHQVTFINLVPPRDKYKIYQYLSEKEDFAKFVPESVPLTYKSLEHFLKKYKKVIVKPFSGALGEKISLIQKLEPFYYISYIHKKRQYNRPIYPRQLYSFYKKYFNNDRYMIQPWIDFKKIDERKFDIRTSVQRNAEGEWKLTGIAGRLATKNRIVTNIAQGGSAIAFSKLEKHLENNAYEKIEELSLKAAKELEALYPGIADLGLDIGIGNDNKLWFIEANFCDERLAYRDIKDNDMWFRSYRFPFEYVYSKLSDY